MSNRMSEPYFDEKKELACEALMHALQEIKMALELIQTSRYAMPDLVSAESVHGMLRDAEVTITGARRDFEKSRWAAAKTGLEFEDWLKNGPASELN